MNGLFCLPFSATQHYQSIENNGGTHNINNNTDHTMEHNNNNNNIERLENMYRFLKPSTHTRYICKCKSKYKRLFTFDKIVVAVWETFVNLV